MHYYEKRLSKDNSLSCNSCHDLGKYGVDGKQFSEGIYRQFGDRNAPTVCHNGPGVGGHIFNKLGLAKPWPDLDPEDIGRAKVTGNDAEKHFFKVPSLRNITETAPFGYKGDQDDLAEMVNLMAEHQLARELTEEQTTSILTFLKSLTGEIPTGLIEEPKLPE